MAEFIRARTEEQFEKRREMILSACDEIYSKEGFLGVTFNSVAERTSFTRPALYNYYRNREEMLMDLLKRNYFKWSRSIMSELQQRNVTTKEEFCSVLADNVSRSEKMFQLLSDVFLIEQGCEVENILELKKGLFELLGFTAGYIRKIFPNATDEKIGNFLDNSTILIFGIYPYTHMHDKQLEALRLAAPEYPVPEIRSMFYKSMMCAISSLE